MKRSLPIVLGTAAATVLLGAGPAMAGHLSVDDPSNDISGHGLDITGATVRNLGHRLVVDVSFARSVRGALVVSVDPRHAEGVRLVSLYDPVGHTDNFVMRGAFTDGDTEDAGRQPCRGFRVRWSADEPSMRMTMPASCLHGGTYGEVRFAVLTERDSDTDYAPGETDSSDWVPRG